jgi:hypothetical protein
MVLAPGNMPAAHAQQTGTRLVATPNDRPEVIRVTRGGRLTLPMKGVTRIIPADEDVVRGIFDSGWAQVEGVSPGTTLVEVHQGSDKRHLISVQVDDPATISRLAQNTSAAAKPVATTPKAAAGAGKPASNTNKPPAPGTVVTPLPRSAVGARAGSPMVVQPSTPVVVRTTDRGSNGQSTAARPNSSGTPALTVPGRSGLFVSLRVAPVDDNPAHALVTLTYGNRGTAGARDVTLRSALDDVVSYVKGSASGSPNYDASARELVWNVGSINANTTAGSVSFRVEPIERTPATFYAVATIEDNSGVPISSNAVKYSFSTAPLLTVFAIPDRFLASRNTNVLVDVRGIEYQNAIDRLQRIGIVNGAGPNLFYPNRATQRSEYAVMTLNGLNLKDLRDVSAIKFVLGRRSAVTLNIRNSKGQIIKTLGKRNAVYQPGEQTLVWDGTTTTGYAPAGRYSYECIARDLTRNGESTKLTGIITVVPQTPLGPSGTPNYVDVKPSDWYAGYLAVAQRQGLMIGVGNNMFEPSRSINRVEATAVVVRALGLEDLAKRSTQQDIGFLDENRIPNWGKGYVFVASSLARTAGGKLIVGYPSNFFLPLKPLRRDEAALIVQRLIDKETNRRVTISGMMVPGALVQINGKNVEAKDDGSFEFTIVQNTAEPTSVAVLGPNR